MQWQDHLFIGAAEVDQQRRRLFDVVNDLKAALHTNRMFEEMGKAIKFMVEYANEHFKAEERFMDSIGYPRANAHKELHNRLTVDIQGILVKMKKDKHVSPSQLMEFITGWLLNHTLIEDLKIRQFQEQSKLQEVAAKLQAYAEARAALSESLKQITNRLKKETITKEAYEAKKSSLLSEFVQVAADTPMDEIMERVALLETFSKDSLISGAEEKQYKVKLFETVDLEAELEKRAKPKAKMHYLKSLLAKDLITEEKFKKYNSVSEGPAPKSDDSNPDVVHLV
ncbi:MAG: hemerythrin family protein [Desulfobacteraceae bacterium]|nr:hemerythrin family protein [Desulfobacteraceae bacterium]